MIVDAVAGSGKTTSILWLIASTWSELTYKLGRPPRVLFSCFNRVIRDELVKRVPRNTASVATLNSLGHKAVSAFLRDRGVSVDVDPKKLYRTSTRLYPKNERELFAAIDLEPRSKEDWIVAYSFLAKKAPEWIEEKSQLSNECFCLLSRNAKFQQALRRLVSLKRATLSSDYEALISKYQIEVSDEASVREALFEGVDVVIRDMEDEAFRTGVIDYDEQIWLPWSWQLDIWPYDAVFIDEAQDVNEAQLSLIRKAAGFRGRMVFVGDLFQAIYGFRGAGIGMIQRIEMALSGTIRGVVHCPLSICYRCPTSVIDLVKRCGHVTQIEAAPGAPAGSVTSVPAGSKWWKDIDLEAMILCRTNAPLIEAYFDLIRAEIRATIRGRGDGGIYDDLMDLIKACSEKAAGLSGMLAHASGHCDKLVAKAEKLEKFDHAARTRDLFRVLEVLALNASSVAEMKAKIDKIFVFDNEEDTGVVLSTVHKAKGLEANDVYVLRPDLIPWPFASGWEVEQEQNLEYVCFTRAKRSLTFIGSHSSDEPFTR